MALGESLADGPIRALGRTKRLLASSLGALETQMVLESETIAAQAGSPKGTKASMRSSRSAGRSSIDGRANDAMKSRERAPMNEDQR